MKRVAASTAPKPRAVSTGVVLPSSDWHLSSYSDSNQHRTCWVSPTKQIKFRLLKDAIVFEHLRKEFNQDETRAWEVYSKNCNEKCQPRRVINPTAHDVDANDTHLDLESCGWIKCLKLTRPNQRYVWLSPVHKIPFSWPKKALQFLQFLHQYEDESVAIKEFIEIHKAGSTKISDFILGGEQQVNRHIDGEIDTDNIIALTKGLKIEIVPADHEVIETSQGLVHCVRTCCNSDGLYTSKKNRKTIIFDYEVIVPISNKKLLKRKGKKDKRGQKSGAAVKRVEPVRDYWKHMREMQLHFLLNNAGLK